METFCWQQKDFDNIHDIYQTLGKLYIPCSGLKQGAEACFTTPTPKEIMVSDILGYLELFSSKVGILYFLCFSAKNSNVPNNLIKW